MKSLDDAVNTYSVQHVTFTFPKDLSKGQIKSFQEKLKHRHPNVVVDYWSAGQLTAKLLGSESGRQIARHIFGAGELDRLERAIRAQRDVDSAGQALEALSATSSLLSDDPYFDYSTGSRPASAPQPPAVPGTTMRVEVSDEAGSVQHIDALATPAATGRDRLPYGQIRLVGEETIERFQKFLRDGGQVQLDEVEIEVENLPKHFEELIESVSQAQVIIKSNRREPVSTTVTIEVHTDAGDFAADFPMRAEPAPPGWDWRLTGVSEGAELVMDLRDEGAGAQVNFNWRWVHGAAAPTSKRLQGVLFVEAMSGSGEIRLIHKDSGRVLARGNSPQLKVDDDTRMLKQIFSDVLALEEWLGRAIVVPESVSADDANALRRIAALIHGINGSWNSASFTIVPTEHSARLESGGVLQARRELSVRLFGEEYSLGEEATYIDNFEVKEATENDDGSVTYVFQPANESSRMLMRLEPLLSR